MATPPGALALTTVNVGNGNEQANAAGIAQVRLGARGRRAARMCSRQSATCTHPLAANVQCLIRQPLPLAAGHWPYQARAGKAPSCRATRPFCDV